MASYSDDKNALYWKKYINNKDKLKDKVYKYLKEITPNITVIDDIYIKYWDEGVHYFYPLNNNNNFKEFIYNLTNPANDIQVIGEIVSLRQGWVEGAIESVDRIIK